jgi:hypothetical protein
MLDILQSVQTYVAVPIMAAIGYVQHQVLDLKSQLKDKADHNDFESVEKVINLHKEYINDRLDRIEAKLDKIAER